MAAIDNSPSPVWPPLPADHPLRTFSAQLPTILSSAGHSEIWGITLRAAPSSESATGDEAPLPPFHTLLILQKYLRANQNDIDKAGKQLSDTLKWRKEFQPAKVLAEGGKNSEWEKFKGLGYITKTKVKDGAEKVITWNIYGAVKDFKVTFGDVDEFIRWRVSLMELSIEHLSLPSAVTPIPDYDANTPTVDPYQTIQVHDYASISFFRSPPEVRAASKKTIELFASVYPELLEKKYFVNIPAVMAWMFAAMKLLIPSVTRSKLLMLGDGKLLREEIGEEVPAAYGGEGAPLEEAGITIGKTEAALPGDVEIDTTPKNDEVKIATGKDEAEIAHEKDENPSAEAVSTLPATCDTLKQDETPTEEVALEEKKLDKGKQPERECYDGACQEEGFPEELKKNCCGKCVGKGKEKEVDETVAADGSVDKSAAPLPIDFTTVAQKNSGEKAEEKGADVEEKEGNVEVDAAVKKN